MIKPSMVPLLLAVPALLIQQPVAADPPPWAPAHGYYKCKDKKHGPECKDKGRVYDRRDNYDYGPYISGGRCNREQLGGLIGGIVGGVAGSQIGKGDDRTITTIAGTVIGILVGRAIGRSMDEADQACTGQALEYLPDHESVTWRNPDSGRDYVVTPLRTWRSDDGRYCRDYQTEAAFSPRERDILLSTACRSENGRWSTSYR